MACMNSLRSIVYDQDEDSMLTKIGYRLDVIMNSSYHCGIYTLNAVMLFWTDDVVDILLNALAIEFVKDLDEVITSGGWYDTEYRHLKAGAFEMVIRCHMKFHILRRNLEQFSKSAPLHTLLNRESSMYDSRKHVKGLEGQEGLSKDELEELATHEEATVYTRTPPAHFYSIRKTVESWKMDNGDSFFYGYIAYVVAMFFPTKPIFEKWTQKYLHNYSTAWDVLVYAKEKVGNTVPGAEFLSIERTKARLGTMKNIQTEDDWTRAVAGADNNEAALFKRHRKYCTYEELKTTFLQRKIQTTLLFADLPKRLSIAVISHGGLGVRISKVAFFVIFGILDAISVTIELLFPLLFVFLLFFIPYCY